MTVTTGTAAAGVPDQQDRILSVTFLRFILCFTEPGAVTVPARPDHDENAPWGRERAHLVADTDPQGRPHLPGTSLAGALRDMVAAAGGAAAADELFGHLLPAGTGGSEVDAKASLIWVLGSQPVAADGSELEVVATDVRASTAISRTRAAAEADTLRVEEVLPAGTRFEVFLRWDNAPADGRRAVRGLADRLAAADRTRGQPGPGPVRGRARAARHAAPGRAGRPAALAHHERPRPGSRRRHDRGDCRRRGSGGRDQAAGAGPDPDHRAAAGRQRATARADRRGRAAGHAHVPGRRPVRAAGHRAERAAPVQDRVHLAQRRRRARAMPGPALRHRRPVLDMRGVRPRRRSRPRMPSRSAPARWCACPTRWSKTRCGSSGSTWPSTGSPAAPRTACSTPSRPWSPARSTWWSNRSRPVSPSGTVTEIRALLRLALEDLDDGLTGIGAGVARGYGSVSVDLAEAEERGDLPDSASARQTLQVMATAPTPARR